MNGTSPHWYEDVKERLGPFVIRSDVRPATDAEIAEARRLHAEGRCPHTIVRDEAGWLYDERLCVVCGRSLGSV